MLRSLRPGDVIRFVEVIEVTEAFRTTQILKINNLLARITLFRCFEEFLSSPDRMPSMGRNGASKNRDWCRFFWEFCI